MGIAHAHINLKIFSTITRKLNKTGEQNRNGNAKIIHILYKERCRMHLQMSQTSQIQPKIDRKMHFAYIFIALINFGLEIR